MRKIKNISIILDEEQPNVMGVKDDWVTVWVPMSSSAKEISLVLQEARELANIEGRLMTIDAWSKMSHNRQGRTHLLKQLPVGGSMSTRIHHLIRRTELIIEEQINPALIWGVYSSKSPSSVKTAWAFLFIYI